MTWRGKVGAQLCLCLLMLPVFGQPKNVRVSSTSISDPEEVTIAINPVNPLELAAGSNLRYFYRSADGGQSWSTGLLPPGTWGDPCVLFGDDGTLYYAHLANLSAGYFIDRLIVHRSTNGGLSWKDSAEVGYHPPRRGQDKEWLAVDATGSPFRGRVYVAWTEFDSYGSSNPADSTRILFAHTSDGGSTWSSPVRVSDRLGDCFDSDGTVEGAVPAVGLDGEVYLSWSGPLGIMFDKSTDGGVTWGEDGFVADQPGGWDFDIAGISRANGFPVTACDVSSSPYRGRIYIAWSDQRNGLDNTDVFLISSTDGGAGWGPVRRVNDDLTVRHQFFTWMTVDQSTGTVWLVFYDRRATGGNSTEVYVARSTDGGQSFENFRISEMPFVPQSSVFFGDYINIAALGGYVYPIWMRMDSGKLSVWTAPIVDSSVVHVGETAEQPRTVALLQNFPNPYNPTTEIRFQLAKSGPVRLVVYDLLGREVCVLVDGVREAGTHSVVFDARELSGGIYIYRLIVGGQTDSRRMVYLR